MGTLHHRLIHVAFIKLLCPLAAACWGETGPTGPSAGTDARLSRLGLSTEIPGRVRSVCARASERATVRVICPELVTDFTTRYPYEHYADGAAFDPATRTWRTLPPAPIDARQPLLVWTGQEMIVWGNQDREDRKVDGAAYDPDTNSWRPIADAPIELTDASASWTGQEMIVFGAALHGGNVPESPSAIGAAYDPTSDTWRTIAESDIDTNANDSVWIGDRLLAWDYDLASQTYHPGKDRWTNAGDVPTDECEDTPSTVFAGAAFGRLCGDLVTFDGADSRWDLLDDPAPKFFPLELFGAGDTFLVTGVAGDFGEGDDWQFFAYRATEPGPVGERSDMSVRDRRHTPPRSLPSSVVTPSANILATGSVSGELLGEPSAELRANLADSVVRLFTPYLSM